MRMRFQSGFADLNNPNAENKKPRLAVTTRTLEALIRLATAHAKLKLRKDEVLPEDVREAYKLMLVAREEDVPEPSAPSAVPPPGDEGGDDGDGQDVLADGQPRGQKRSAGEAALGEAAGGIAPARFRSFQTLVGRTFARLPDPKISRGELLESVNAGLAEGEPVFSEGEFAAGIEQLEGLNKVFVVVETGDVLFLG